MTSQDREAGQRPAPTREPHRGVSLFDPDLPPHQQVLGLFYAKWVTGALRAAVELRVPDVLASGPRSTARIATETGADPDALYRILRAIAATGVLDEDEEGVFALTPLAAGLVSGAENGIREMFLFASDPMLWRPYTDLAHTARTGHAAFEGIFGRTFYDYLRDTADSSALFDGAMRQNSYPETDVIFEEFDFGRFRRLADVGGGKGQFLTEILLRYPDCAGVLVDQPHTLADARATFEKAGVADRVELVPADFFVHVPEGCDAYFVKHTLHNWGDHEAGLVMRRIREAMGHDRDARLLIVDQLLRGPGEWDIGKLIDIEALAVIGGRERGRGEWHRLAAAAGFAPVDEPEPGGLVLQEYRPA